MKESRRKGKREGREKGMKELSKKGRGQKGSKEGRSDGRERKIREGFPAPFKPVLGKLPARTEKKHENQGTVK